MAKLYVAFLGIVIFAITWSANRQASEEARLLRQAQRDEQLAEAAIEAEHARGALLALQNGDVELAEWYARWYRRPLIEGLDGACREAPAR